MKTILLIAAFAMSSVAQQETNLFQVRGDGSIWNYNCGPLSCPGWQQLDQNARTRSVAGKIYKLHNDGSIWREEGLGSGVWNQIDNNRRTRAIAVGALPQNAANPMVVQLHNDGSIYRYIDSPCNGSSCPQDWEMLDQNPRTTDIAMAPGDTLYQLHNDGSIWVYTGTPCAEDICPGWQMLDNNPRTTAIAPGFDGQIFQIQMNGSIWEYTGTPCSSNGCPGWRLLDNNPASSMITAGAVSETSENLPGRVSQLFQMHRDGSIWAYTGTPCSGGSCPGWQMLDNNPGTRQIAAAGYGVFQLRSDGSIWSVCVKNFCLSDWEMRDNNPATIEIYLAPFFFFHS